VCFFFQVQFIREPQHGGYHSQPDCNSNVLYLFEINPTCVVVVVVVVVVVIIIIIVVVVFMKCRRV
jgi:hypothetical protein